MRESLRFLPLFLIYLPAIDKITKFPFLKNILIIGAGKSSPALVSYLNQQANAFDWQITIADKNLGLLHKISHNQTHVEITGLDVLDEEARDAIVQKADLVLSMVPARFHPLVLESCIKAVVDLITPSYQSKEMLALQPEVTQAGILVLNEMGLDPGIDHMSAMKVINQIKQKGYKITCFESFTGGLMAPGSDNNEWKYKFSWNPRNVVMAGQGGTVRFLHNGKYKYIPYNRLFRRTERINIEGYGSFEGYANRDSLQYIDKYKLQGTETIYRGTLRRPGFCRAWDMFVQLGATDDSYIMEGSEDMTYRDFINSFLPYNPYDSVELKFMHYLRIDQDSDLKEKLFELEIFSNKKIGLKNATPAQILEHILLQKWTMQPKDQDMVVMWHKFFYHNVKERLQQTSSMVVQGKNSDETAMAKTVGLPMGIAAKLVLQGKINLKGLQLPVVREIYQPVLQELEHYDIKFNDNIFSQTNHEDDRPIF